MEADNAMIILNTQEFVTAVGFRFDLRSDLFGLSRSLVITTYNEQKEPLVEYEDMVIDILVPWDPHGLGPVQRDNSN